jgi:glycogen operon protein
MRSTTSPHGASFPLGATIGPGGVNFSVFSKHATGVQLLLFDRVTRPSRRASSISIRGTQRSYHYWHAFVPGIAAGQLYGYRVDGPFDPTAGTVSTATRCSSIRTDGAWRGPRVEPRRRSGPGDNCASALKSVVHGSSPLSTGRRPAPAHALRPGRSSTRCTSGAFTRNPNSGVPALRRGTYQGVIDKIPYLQDLGVTAVELLPSSPSTIRTRRAGLNDWGYQPVSFFAPHPGYSSRPDPLAPSTTSATW